MQISLHIVCIWVAELLLPLLCWVLGLGCFSCLMMRDAHSTRARAYAMLLPNAARVTDEMCGNEYFG